MRASSGKQGLEEPSGDAVDLVKIDDTVLGGQLTGGAGIQHGEVPEVALRDIVAEASPRLRG